MRKSRFSETQIVEILKEEEAGLPVGELLRRHGISRATYFQWKSKYSGATVADLKRLKELARPAEGRGDAQGGADQTVEAKAGTGTIGQESQDLAPSAEPRHTEVVSGHPSLGMSGGESSKRRGAAQRGPTGGRPEHSERAC